MVAGDMTAVNTCQQQVENQSDDDDASEANSSRENEPRQVRGGSSRFGGYKGKQDTQHEFIVISIWFVWTELHD